MKGTHKGKSFYTDFSEWHTYALNWEEDRLTWYTDGNLYNTFAPDNTNDYAKWPFNRRFYLILNLALGGNLGGHISFEDDQVMEIDYVRVFCLDGSTNCTQEEVTSALRMIKSWRSTTFESSVSTARRIARKKRSHAVMHALGSTAHTLAATVTQRKTSGIMSRARLEAPIS